MIIQDPFQTALNQALMSTGQAFGQGLQRGQATRKQEDDRQRYGSILQNTLGGLEENSSPIDVTKALTLAMSQGLPAEIAKSYGQLYSNLQRSQKTGLASPEQVNEMATLFQKFGMEEDVAGRNAELWGKLTTGGQTEMAKMLVDQISRNQFGSGSNNIGSGNVTNELLGSQSGTSSGSQKFSYPKVNVFEDRTPKERISLKTDLLKSNTIKVSDASESLRKKENLDSRYSQLETLNESGRLPDGLENLNINWTTGDIRFPKLANPETQAYVKAINDFTTQAKDTFGSNVTNFELGAFMKRLPTLANSTEGRRIILNQMKLSSEADKLYDKALLDTYSHYGTQKIDFANADKIARDVIKSQTDIIRKKAIDNLESADIQEGRLLAPEGKVLARGPDGKKVYIWTHQADKAKSKGYTVL